MLGRILTSLAAVGAMALVVASATWVSLAIDGFLGPFIGVSLATIGGCIIAEVLGAVLFRR